MNFRNGRAPQAPFPNAGPHELPASSGTNEAPSLEGLDVRGAVLTARETWGPHDGRQEVHFSTQEPGKRPGGHAQTVDLEAFASFVDDVGDLPLDCVLEVKDKEQSVLRARELVHAAA